MHILYLILNDFGKSLKLNKQRNIFVSSKESVLCCKKCGEQNFIKQIKDFKKGQIYTLGPLK